MALVARFATHTMPWSAAMPAAPRPTYGCSPTLRPLWTSSRVMRGSWMLSTHTAPPATMTPRGRRPTSRIVAPTRAPAGLAAGFAVAAACALRASGGARCPPPRSGTSQRPRTAIPAPAARAPTASPRRRGGTRAGSRAGGEGVVVAPRPGSGPLRCPTVATVSVAAVSLRGNGSDPTAACAARPRSPADCCRSAGSFASARATTASSAAGRPGLTVDGRGGSSTRCAHSFAWSESRSNGTRPVSTK